MEALYSLEASRIVGGLPHDQYLAVAGRMQAYETVYSLIETLDKQASALNDHRSRTREAKRTTDERIRTQRDLTFAGSPWFGIANKPKP